jgi:hypothetical protein
MHGLQILCNKNCPESGQAAFKESSRKLSVRKGTKVINLTDLWGNAVNAITNFINPEFVIAKSLILYVPLDHKINPVYAIHVIITI